MLDTKYTPTELHLQDTGKCYTQFVALNHDGKALAMITQPCTHGTKGMCILKYPYAMLRDNHLYTIDELKVIIAAMQAIPADPYA